MCEEEMMESDDMTIDDEDTSESFYNPIKRHAMLSRKNHDAINKFLGEGPRSVEVNGTEWYYGKLLAWTVKCIITSPGWKTVSVHGYSRTEPIYRDVQTDYTKFESCIGDGQMLVENGDVRFVITISTWQRDINFIQVDAAVEHQEKVKKLLLDIAGFMKKNNFYRGKKICLDHDGISLLTVGQRDWDSIILDPAMKKAIRLNTIGFLKYCDQLEKYGVPPRRGIILAGEPGTGKTIVCIALMSEADNITCITTTAYGMVQVEYISVMFSIAQDLSPSIVFLEDLDFIGQERRDFYRGTPTLIALLAEMDGIAEKKAIVTVATSNCVETLDKALSERPQRFDRVFKISRPTYQLRAELLKYIAKNIPLSEDIIEYMAKKTEGFTPAQIQEVSSGMVISYVAMGEEIPQFTRSDVDSVISLINCRKSGKLGFNGVP